MCRGWCVIGVNISSPIPLGSPPGWTKQPHPDCSSLRSSTRVSLFLLDRQAIMSYTRTPHTPLSWKSEKRSAGCVISSNSLIDTSTLTEVSSPPDNSVWGHGNHGTHGKALSMRLQITPVFGPLSEKMYLNSIARQRRRQAKRSRRRSFTCERSLFSQARSPWMKHAVRGSADVTRCCGDPRFLGAGIIGANVPSTKPPGPTKHPVTFAEQPRTSFRNGEPQKAVKAGFPLARF